MQASVTSEAMAGTSAVQARKRIAVWLLIVCAMIFSMVVLGGVTRLTESGLSIVTWQPVMGVVPPLTHQAWDHGVRTDVAISSYGNFRAADC